MEIRLDRLGDEPFTWHEAYEFTTKSLDRAELIALTGVDCAGTIRSVSSGFLFQANVSYQQTLACMRCLRPTELPIENQIELLLVADREEVIENEAAVERELNNDDLSVVYLPGLTFDPEATIQEQLQLNVPMKPLCRPDCAGLCNTCGADLNDGPCECQPDTDPRWSALAKLKTQLDS